MAFSFKSYFQILRSERSDGSACTAFIDITLNFDYICLGDIHPISTQFYVYVYGVSQFTFLLNDNRSRTIDHHCHHFTSQGKWNETFDDGRNAMIEFWLYRWQKFISARKLICNQVLLLMTSIKFIFIYFCRIWRKFFFRIFLFKLKSLFRTSQCAIARLAISFLFYKKNPFKLRMEKTFYEHDEKCNQLKSNFINKGF